MDEDDITTTTTTNAELTEFTLTLKSARTMSVADILIELEYLICEMANAEAKLREAGEHLH